MQRKFGIAVVMALLAAPVASRRRSTVSLSRLCDSGGTFLSGLPLRHRQSAHGSGRSDNAPDRANR